MRDIRFVRCVVLALVFVVFVTLAPDSTDARRGGIGGGSRGKGGGSKSGGSKSGSKDTYRTHISVKGGTRTSFSRPGSYGKGGKSPRGYSKLTWKHAVLVGLASGVASRWHPGFTGGTIYYYGSEEYRRSERYRDGISPTVCYNDDEIVNGSLKYYFLCPVGGLGDEEYCCDRNDNTNKQYCCTESDWNSATTHFASAWTMLLLIVVVALLS